MYKLKIRKALANQALGLLPLFFFLLLSLISSYLITFMLSILMGFLCLFFYLLFYKQRLYQFMLLVSSIVLIFYALFLSLRFESVFFHYSPITMEVFLVITLIFVGLLRTYILDRVKNAPMSIAKRFTITNNLKEFFFISQIIQNVYTLHLFFLILLGIVTAVNERPGDIGDWGGRMTFMLGFIFMVYESIRLSLMNKNLRKEVWIPILNEDKKVIGSMALSVSLAYGKRYVHPVVRIIIVNSGMLYLSKRPADSYISAGKLDTSFRQYVLFRQTIDEAVQDCMKIKDYAEKLQPHFLLNYTFENKKVKHFVSLYVVHLDDEQIEKLDYLKGKLWSAKQIEDNLNKGVFSEYLETEFSYIRNTVLTHVESPNPIRSIQ